MANKEHVKMLGQGAAVWNGWREMHPDVWPDLVGADLRFANLSETDLRFAALSDADLSETNLSNADLRFADLSSSDPSDANLSDARFFSDDRLNGANLRRADLSYANLRRANLNDANLHRADLSGANLRHADLSSANLSSANLHRADLSSANLSDADLRRANLSGADLSSANLSGADLRRANFSTAHFSFTILAWVDLGKVQGLDTIIHEGPSTININTVKLPQGETRRHFLQGVGFPDTVIEYYDSLYTQPLQYASCFICYAHEDEALAQRLYKDLQDKGVRCWFAPPHDLHIGDKIRSRIDQAIYFHEKLLLLLSESSLANSWVETEVEAALEREDLQKCEVLFPIRLDDTVMHTSQAWAATLCRTRHIGDFTHWQNEVGYQQHFAELLRHLTVKLGRKDD